MAAPKMSRRPDGRYVKRVKDSRTGKTVYFYGMTMREVNEKLLAYQGQEEQGRTFREVAAEWWEDTESELAYNSVKSYKPAMERVVNALGDYTVKEIKPRHISSFLRSMTKTGYGSKSIAKMRMVINLICKHGLMEGDIEINPCTAVDTPPSTKKAARTAATPTDEQIVRKTHDIWLLPFFALMTGMRRGEILALQWKDIDFDAGVIHVTKSVYHKGDRPFIKEPKTEESKRIVPLLAPLREVLEDVIQKTNHQKDHFIISDNGTKPLTNRRYITLFDNYVQKTGIQCTAHQLRHSFATVAFECGVPLKSVQEILGHKQLSTTMDIYTDFRKKSVETAAEILNQKLTQNSEK